jgi:hypothetical protein
MYIWFGVQQPAAYISMILSCIAAMLLHGIWAYSPAHAVHAWQMVIALFTGSNGWVKCCFDVVQVMSFTVRGGKYSISL